jgi:hypothetical protein
VLRLQLQLNSDVKKTKNNILMNSVFREHLPPLWFGFIGAAAQYPKMENGKR